METHCCQGHCQRRYINAPKCYYTCWHTIFMTLSTEQHRHNMINLFINCYFLKNMLFVNLYFISFAYLCIEHLSDPRLSLFSDGGRLCLRISRHIFYRYCVSWRTSVSVVRRGMLVAHHLFSFKLVWFTDTEEVNTETQVYHTKCDICTFVLLCGIRN